MTGDFLGTVLYVSPEQAMARRRQKLQQKMAARLLADSLGLGETARQENLTKSVSRRGSPPGAVLKARGLTLDMEAMVATKEDQPLSLTPTEFRLLVTLMKRANHPHTFQELAEVTHGQQVDVHQARDLLKSHIGRLRQKLGRDSRGRVYIDNVRGVGYKFVSDEKYTND